MGADAVLAHPAIRVAKAMAMMRPGSSLRMVNDPAALSPSSLAPADEHKLKALRIKN
jgi:hypothetical protein